MFSRFTKRVGMVALSWPLFAAPATAQPAYDLAVLGRTSNVEARSSTVRHGSDQELKKATLGLIRLYQKVLSPQDAPTCTFSVSCSRFAVAAIERHGLLHGTAMAADRILRCNGVGSRHYEQHSALLLAIDLPVDRYRLGRPSAVSARTGAR